MSQLPNLALSPLDAAKMISESCVCYLQELGSYPSPGFVQSQKAKAGKISLGKDKITHTNKTLTLDTLTLM